MDRRAARLALVTTIAALLAATGCKKNEPLVDPNPVPGPGLSNPTVNLFGFEESQIHWLHYNVQRRGRVRLARFDPADPEKMERNIYRAVEKAFKKYPVKKK